MGNQHWIQILFWIFQRRDPSPEEVRGYLKYLEDLSPKEVEDGVMWAVETYLFGRSGNLKGGFSPALGLFVRGLNDEGLSGRIFLRKFSTVLKLCVGDFCRRRQKKGLDFFPFGVLYSQKIRAPAK